MGDLAQKFGAQMRYHSSLPPRLNEFAILITARIGRRSLNGRRITKSRWLPA